MAAWAREEDQAGLSKQKVTAIGASQAEAARLQQVNMTALVSAIVRRRTAKLPTVKQVRADAELRQQGRQAVHRASRSKM
ncbi:hypothetical protein D9M69_695830 [compost metagenome]